MRWTRGYDECSAKRCPPGRSRPSATPAAGDQAELRLTLVEALGHLPPRDRAIVVLRYWEDLSVREVAGLLRLSESNVKIQSMRALAKLRVLLDDDAPTGSPTGRR